MVKRIVMVSDIQAPYHDPKAVNAVIKFIGDYQPDQVIQIGDLADYPHPSRWNKGERGEFEGSVLRDSEDIKKNILKPIRNVYSGPFGILEGNHDLRPRAYLTKYAPALVDFAEDFHFEKLLDFDGFGIERLPDFYRIAKDWTVTHGHLGGPKPVQDAGRTALRFVQRFQESVVIGHTHRMGVVHTTHGRGGDGDTLTGVEVGHLMDMKKAQYLNGSTANWQKGFVVLYVDGNHVQPVLVRIDRNRFVFEGRVYKV